MKKKTVEWAFGASGVDDAVERVVLLAMALFADKRGVADVAKADLARACCVPREAVSVALMDLCARGLLKRVELPDDTGSTPRHGFRVLAHDEEAPSG